MEANKIIITGGSTRIGAAIAEKLSGPGKEIVIHFNRSKTKAEKLKKKLSKNKYFYLKKRLTEKEKSKLLSLGEKGIIFESTHSRIYPQG